VVITGAGIVSPLGHTVEEVAARVRRGDGALQPLAALGFPDTLGAIVDIPLDCIPTERRMRIGRLDRLCRLFLTAAYLALDDARLQIGAGEAERAGLSFGTGLGCVLTNAEYNQKLVEHGPAAASPRLFAYTVSSAAAGEVSIALGIRGPNVTSHAGLAAGLQAIGYGADLIRLGKADVVLAGGADALGEALVRGLADLGLVGSRDGAGVESGMTPAEGAAVLVLESAEHARRRGAHVRTSVRGYAAGFEPTLPRREGVPDGISNTMRRALAASGVDASDVDVVIRGAHAGTAGALEARALQEVFGNAQPVTVAPKAAWGETFGADGALSVALASVLLDDPRPHANHRRATRRTAPGPSPLALVHSLCYSGPSVALVLAREE
jgi:3-oxoacyl-[acyl-carrier-protein] synthase II